MGSQPVSLAQLRQLTLSKLSPQYGQEEAEALFRRLLMHFLPEWQLLWLQSRGEALCPPDLLSKWEGALHRLSHYEPIAYIIGKTHFVDIELLILPGVFIPRPETESWAYALYAQLAVSPRTILDIGTGSGALAIFFAQRFPHAQVYAVDKNPLAILLAERNAVRNGVSIHTAILTFGQEPLPEYFPRKWDLIVSNPPYVPWEAYSETGENVRLFEPPEAIFCTGFELYERIAIYAYESLSTGGRIAVEVFPPHAESIAALWKDYGLAPTLHKDERGLWRWIVAVREGEE
ncbi:MAG: HemK family protein methyltransferase [Bacteroidia bacterium]|nr:HemK family protein methyltransferase [Bacteroidia bacterium]MCX7764004.1 HemK family protein methyltransferase [Bacteroidia bacterium]MDW8056864.1 HemK family protein methyltransferase [Bacteroidia bacterium]